MIYYLRQSAVIQYKSSDKTWREELVCSCLGAAGHETSVITSEFNHYTKEKRDANTLNKNVVFIKSIGYQSNTSLARSLDAVIFSVNCFKYLRKIVQATDTVIVAMPTPESVFAVSLLKYFKQFTLVVDFRDSWPRAFNSKNRAVHLLFTGYIYILLKLSIPAINKSIFMSHSLKLYYSRFLGSAESIVLPNPIPTLIRGADVVIKKQIMFFGTINEQFNFQLLDHLLNIQAIREYEFVIYGDGYNLDSLRDQYSNSSRVSFKGSINYGALLEKALEAKMFFIPFANPSNYKNHFSNKMSEMIAFGKPILTNLDNTIFNVNTTSYDIGLNFEALELLTKEDVESFLDGFTLNSSGLEIDAFNTAILDTIEK